MQPKSSLRTAPKNRPTTRFHHRKQLGQNFLQDNDVIQTIADSADLSAEDTVIEIGPGDGALTTALATRAGRVIAVEIDDRLIPVLHTVLRTYPNVDVLAGDIMKHDIPGILEQSGFSGYPGQSVKVLGNLPYYITTPLLMRLLEERNRRLISTITVMVQKEVADRIEAGPGSRTFGALSVAIQYHCSVARIAAVPATAFHPQPKVDSAVLRLTVREQPAVTVASEATFFKTVRTAFGQRRKTLQNALSGLTGGDREVLLRAFKEAGIDPGRRAETLSLEEFAKLAEAIGGS